MDKKCNSDVCPLRRLQSPFVVHCCLKKKLCFLWFLCAVEPEQQPQKEKQPSPGIWGEGKQKCLISFKLWLCSNSSHSRLFLSFPLHLYDSQQKIDSGREWIVGDAEAFLSRMSIFLACCQNQTAVRPWSSGCQREELIAVGLIRSLFLPILHRCSVNGIWTKEAPSMGSPAKEWLLD